MFKLKSEERTMNVNIKKLNEENQRLLNMVKMLQEENMNLKRHLTIKEGCIIDQKFKIRTLLTQLESLRSNYENNNI